MKASAVAETAAIERLLELDRRGVVFSARHRSQLQGKGELLTGWSLPSAKRE